MPPVGTIVAVTIGVAEVPDFFTTIGGIVMVAGVLMIAKATATKEVRVDLNPAAKTV